MKKALPKAPSLKKKKSLNELECYVIQGASGSTSFTLCITTSTQKKFTPVLGSLPRKSPAKYLKQTHFQTFLSPRHFCRHCQGSKSKHGEENKQNIAQPSPALLPCAKPLQWDDHSQAGSWIGLGFLKKRLLQLPVPPSTMGTVGRSITSSASSGGREEHTDPTVSEAKEDQTKPLHHISIKENQVQNDKRRVQRACCAQGGVLLALPGRFDSSLVTPCHQNIAGVSNLAEPAECMETNCVNKQSNPSVLLSVQLRTSS